MGGRGEGGGRSGRRCLDKGQRLGPPSPHCLASPTCQAMWLPLVLLLLLLPVVPVPSATAAPIPDANAKSQDSLESMLQGCNRLLLEFVGRVEEEREEGGGKHQEKSEGHRERESQIK